MGRHQGALTRIWETYQGGPGLMIALETYINTQQGVAADQARAVMAEAVCEHLHDGPPSGIKCLSCYSAEANVRETLVVEAEREASFRDG
jgi:hypothetical protein